MLFPSSTLGRSESLSLADGMSRVSAKLKWSKPAEMNEFDKAAEIAAGTGYRALEDLLDTSKAERDHFTVCCFRAGGLLGKVHAKDS